MHPRNFCVLSRKSGYIGEGIDRYQRCIRCVVVARDNVDAMSTVCRRILIDPRAVEEKNSCEDSALISRMREYRLIIIVTPVNRYALARVTLLIGPR